MRRLASKGTALRAFQDEVRARTEGLARKKSQTTAKAIELGLKLALEADHPGGKRAELYKRLFNEQRGLCAICGRFESAGHRARRTAGQGRYKVGRLSIDHCHATGKIRGLLCAQCNSGLGFFRDSIPSLKAAIKYLQRSTRSSKTRNPL